MSVTGPGCEHCNYTGMVQWIDDPSWVALKPCDHCGGLSQLGGDRDDTIARLTRERDEALAKVREYDSWVCWETNCGHIAKALDMIYSAEDSNETLRQERRSAQRRAQAWKALAKKYRPMHRRAQAAEGQLERVEALRKHLAETASERDRLAAHVERLLWPHNGEIAELRAEVARLKAVEHLLTERCDTLSKAYDNLWLKHNR